jgi:hypothetical protein
MGGTSTYGIELEDGSVVYNIYRDTVFHESILHEFTQGRSVDVLVEDSYTATSIEEYYSEERFADEDSIVRGLLRFDGTLEYRLWGDKYGIFTYKKR